MALALEYTKRSLVGMVFKTFLTLGLYIIYWIVSTKNEMNRHGASVPTGWLLIVPIANVYFLYQYSQAFTTVVLQKKEHAMLYTLLYFILYILATPIIWSLIIQSSLNAYKPNENGNALPSK